MHVRPSKILFREIQRLKKNVYILKGSKKKLIRSICDILQMEINEGEVICFETDPPNPCDIQRLSDRIDLINKYSY